MKSIELLRRVNSGDETVLKEIEEFLRQHDELEQRHKDAIQKKVIRIQKAKTTGRLNSGAFEVAHAVEAGVDHGAKGVVLAKNDQYRLVWRGGSEYWSGIGSFRYAPAELEILRYPDKNNHLQERTPIKITDNFLKSKQERETRLSKKLILKYKQQIDQYFGEGTAEKVSSLKATVCTNI